VIVLIGAVIFGGSLVVLAGVAVIVEWRHKRRHSRRGGYIDPPARVGFGNDPAGVTKVRRP
jgi:hypothetical protein